VPGKEALVTIGRDMNVVLDVTPPELHGLTINGKLSFADNKDLELTTEWIMVHGELEIGTEAKPHTRNATITLTDNVKDEGFIALAEGIPRLPIILLNGLRVPYLTGNAQSSARRAPHRAGRSTKGA
jgi:hypothetical protein